MKAFLFKIPHFSKARLELYQNKPWYIWTRLPPWRVTSYCLVFHFLNPADLSELWELAATVVCGPNSISPCARWFLFTGPKICLPLSSQVRLKAAPALVLLFLSLLRLSGLLESSAPLAAYSFGALSGWVYLRFYQRHSRGRGDMSDHFAFASFFPEALQPAVGLLAGLVHAALVKLKVCRKMVKRYDVGAPSSITISLPGTDPQDAERRR